MPKLKTTYQNLHPFILDNLITEFQLGLGDKMWSDIGFGGTDLKKSNYRYTYNERNDI